MAGSFSIQVTGIDKLNKKLNSIEDFVKSPAAMMKEIGESTKEGAEKNFDKKGAEYGTAWASLKASTIAQKRARRLARPTYPLWGTGKMKGSFKSIPKRSEVTVKNTASYAIFHQGGTRSIPQRKILDIQAPQVVKITKIIQKYMQDILKKRM